MTGKLVVIDMQKVFGTSDSDWNTPGFGDIVEPIRRLVEAYGDDVLFTRYVSPQVPHGAWVPYFDDWPFALQPPDADLWEITPGLATAAARQQAAGVGPVTKTTFSKWGPELAEFVGADGRLVLAGVSSTCCVIATALAAADAGVEVWVVSDATAGKDPPTHAQALGLMGLFAPLVRIVTTEEAVVAARSDG